jgi:hypothetical protein
MEGEKIVNNFVKDIMQKDINPDLSLKFPMRGYVVDVRGDNEIEIDLGQDMGVTKGAEVSVIEIGPERKHPVTGKPLPGLRKEIGKLKIKEVSGPESSICEKVNGGPFVAGQVIERVPKN